MEDPSLTTNHRLNFFPSVYKHPIHLCYMCTVNVIGREISILKKNTGTWNAVIIDINNIIGQPGIHKNNREAQGLENQPATAIQNTCTLPV